MDLIAIEKKIDEYRLKIETKVPRIGSLRKKLIPIPGGLKNYYEDEIKKLEKLREIILNPKIYTFSIGWNKIKFEDYQIRANINGRITEPYLLSESRASYEYIKPFIEKANLDDLIVTVSNEKILSIKNLDELNSVIQILSVKEQLKTYFENLDSDVLNNVLSTLKRISNERIIDIYKIEQKSVYLNSLCLMHSSKLKIIPTTEIQFRGEAIIAEEDTFLFSIVRGKNIFIIWESTLVNRATYVFQCSKKSYEKNVQEVFDFIASDQPGKRTMLRQKLKTAARIKNSIAVLQHTNLNSWANKLNRIMMNT
jgi:hypothetical protein